jgi:hypothetical protein
VTTQRALKQAAQLASRIGASRRCLQRDYKAGSILIAGGILCYRAVVAADATNARRSGDALAGVAILVHPPSPDAAFQPRVVVAQANANATLGQLDNARSSPALEDPGAGFFGERVRFTPLFESQNAPERGK